MMRPSVQGVDHPVCCVLDAVVTYARDSSCCLLSSRGGGAQTYWHQTYSYIARALNSLVAKSCFATANISERLSLVSLPVYYLD